MVTHNVSKSSNEEIKKSNKVSTKKAPKITKSHPNEICQTTKKLPEIKTEGRSEANVQTVIKKQIYKEKEFKYNPTFRISQEHNKTENNKIHVPTTQSISKIGKAQLVSETPEPEHVIPPQSPPQLETPSQPQAMIPVSITSVPQVTNPQIKTINSKTPEMNCFTGMANLQYLPEIRGMINPYVIIPQPGNPYPYMMASYMPTIINSMKQPFPQSQYSPKHITEIIYPPRETINDGIKSQYSSFATPLAHNIQLYDQVNIPHFVNNSSVEQYLRSGQQPSYYFQEASQEKLENPINEHVHCPRSVVNNAPNLVKIPVKESNIGAQQFDHPNIVSINFKGGEQKASNPDTVVKLNMPPQTLNMNCNGKRRHPEINGNKGTTPEKEQCKLMNKKTRVGEKERKRES